MERFALSAVVITVNPMRLLMTLAPLVLSSCLLQGGSAGAQAISTPAIGSPGPIPDVTAPLQFSAIQRLNTQVGYVAGWTQAGGGLAKTTDNGLTWQRLTDPSQGINAVRFIDEQIGWVAGYLPRDAAQVACQQAGPPGSQPCRGVVLRTEDGGKSWKIVLAVPTNGVLGGAIIRQLQAVDGQRAWALTVDESTCQTVCPTDVRRTTDAGKTWNSVLHGQIAAMRFASASRGWVALDDPYGGGKVEVRETSDGGTTWKTVLQTSTGNTVALDAASVNTAWLLTRDGAYCSASSCSRYALFRTDNGGGNWLNLGNPKDSAANCSLGHLAGPLFASITRGWLGLNGGAGGADIGSGGILQSDDGGWTWRCRSSPGMVSLVSAADPLHSWAAGTDRGRQLGTLYSTEDGGATWRPLDLSTIP